jgi:hypothetical protein
MKNGMIVIDADGHLNDTAEVYRQRLPERFRHRLASFYPLDGFDRSQNGKYTQNPGSVERNLADNDIEGIDLQI